MLAAVAMIVAVLVFVPAADAVTCGGEVPHAASVSAASPDIHGDSDAHGLCGHGHCHGHGSYVHLEAPVLERVFRVDRPVYLIPGETRRELASADGPERPPRV